MESFEKFIKKIGYGGTAVGAVFISAIALLITATVIGRAFHIAFPGTFDLVETLIVVGIAFALVYGQLEDRHLRADIAIGRIKGRIRHAIESFLGMLNISYWIILFVSGAVMMKNKWEGEEATDVLNVPVVPFRGIWIFALAIMVFLLLIKFAHHIKMLIKGGNGK
jgi:TRAP-type C4-dicarboxylate transport system permease small subunit